MTARWHGVGFALAALGLLAALVLPLSSETAPGLLARSMLLTAVLAAAALLALAAVFVPRRFPDRFRRPDRVASAAP